MGHPTVTLLPRTLLAAAGFLTRLPVGDRTAATGGAAFGVVGAGIGLVAALPVLALRDAQLLGAALAVAFVAIGSGGLHLDGLADTVDAALAALPTTLAVPALVVAAAASRSVPVLGARLVRHREAGLGRWWGDAVRPIDGLACAGTVALVVLVTGSPMHAGAAGLALAVGLATLGLLARRFGVVTGDSHGVAIELAFLVGLVAELAAA